MIENEAQLENIDAANGELTAQSIEVANEESEAKSESGLVAVYRGNNITELPKDLYIPPDALEVFLDHFEGPLDLLLYLIRRQNMDILDIPIVDITKQYVKYIDLMQEMRFELAAEYLVMAAMLAEIKSRMLLPRPAVEEDDELDPRAELVRRLQEYERYKQAGEDLEALDRFGRDSLKAVVDIELAHPEDRPLPKVDLDQLLKAFNEVLIRAEMYNHHHVQMEALSVRERMSKILESVQATEFVEFTSLFDFSEGRMGVVVTFLAILELVKESLLEIVQSELYAPIHIKAKSAVLDPSEMGEDEINRINELAINEASLELDEDSAVH